MSKGRKKRGKIGIVLRVVVSIALLMYPFVSDWWNKLHQSEATADYAEDVRALDDDGRQAMLDEAIRYNEALLAATAGMATEELPPYESVLSLGEFGTMACIRIPRIGVNLPVRHGMDESTLSSAIGHLPTSSLPVGGEGTHCVLMGHRGLPSSTLFTDLDVLKEGDVFLIDVLGETLTYEIDQILTVLPSEMDSLAIQRGKDYCTLVTCTPYGVNSHRLLVRGHRVPTDPGDERAEMIPKTIAGFDPMVFALIVVVVFVLLVWRLSRLPKRGRKKDKENGQDGDAETSEGGNEPTSEKDGKIDGEMVDENIEEVLGAPLDSPDYSDLDEPDDSSDDDSDDGPADGDAT